MTTPDKGDLRDPQTDEIIGAAMAVHRALGVRLPRGCLPSGARPRVRLSRSSVRQRGQAANLLSAHPPAVGYRADFICYDAIIVEVKALPALSSLDDAILLNYLKAAQLQRGLLLNFGARSLEYRRRVLTSVSEGSA
jgi:GxxExxY protein